jgi:hypothetical protein
VGGGGRSMVGRVPYTKIKFKLKTETINLAGMKKKRKINLKAPDGKSKMFFLKALRKKLVHCSIFARYCFAAVPATAGIS